VIALDIAAPRLVDWASAGSARRLAERADDGVRPSTFSTPSTVKLPAVALHDAGVADLAA